LIDKLKKIPKNKIMFVNLETENINITDDYFDYVFNSIESSGNKSFFPYPEITKITRLSCGFVVDDTIRIKVLSGEEADIIKEFYTFVQGKILCGYNLTGFIIPYIRLRAMSLNIDIPESIDERGLKPWDISFEVSAKLLVIDLLPLIKGTLTSFISLHSACFLMGIRDYFEDKSNQFIAIIKLYLRLVGEDINKSVVYASEEKKTLLQSIIDSKSIPEDLSVFKDVENAETILLAAVVNLGDPDYGIGKDTEEEIENKRLLINKALNYGN
jgi:hypothetical protein